MVLHLIDMRLEVYGLKEVGFHLINLATIEVHHRTIMGCDATYLLIVVHLVRYYGRYGQQLHTR